jgi:hypothetical protein
MRGAGADDVSADFQRGDGSMCLTYCHRRDLFFDSDTDDVCGVCSFNFQDEPTLLAAGRKACNDCVHQSGDACALAHAPQPARRWCCHCNVRPRGGWADVTIRRVRGHLHRADLALTLNVYEAEYELSAEGVYRVNLDTLAVPLVYGVPVEHWVGAIRPDKHGVVEVESISNLDLDWIGDLL